LLKYWFFVESQRIIKVHWLLRIRSPAHDCFGSIANLDIIFLSPLFDVANPSENFGKPRQEQVISTEITFALN